MSSNQKVAPSGKLIGSGNRFWFYFFATIGVLLLITITLITIALVRAPSEEHIQAERIKIHELLIEYSDQTLGVSFPDTEENIDKLVDKAFAPAYKNIDVFADFHFTVWGEYTEILLAASGQLEEKIAEILFEGLQERLDDAIHVISVGLQNELADNFKAEAEHHAAMEIAIKDMRRRFEKSDIALKGGAAIGMGATGVTITKAISAAIAKKLVAVTTAKTTGKVAAKVAAGTAAGTATGATIGSFIPGAGTAVGGIIGGILGWFLVDKAAVELDEHWNRAEFEKEVETLIDEQKAQVKSEIRKRIEATIIDVRNKTPLELIRGTT